MGCITLLDDLLTFVNVALTRLRGIHSLHSLHMYNEAKTSL
jgi:hypothetical protein